MLSRRRVRLQARFASDGLARGASRITASAATRSTS